MEPEHYQHLLTYLTTNIFPSSFNTQQQNQLNKQLRNYHIKNNLLYKQDRNNPKNFIRVIQQWEMEPVLYMFHNDPTAAHASKNKMMDKMKTRFYWP